MKQLLFSFLLLAAAQIASAQDKIYTTTQKTPIEGEVTEVTTNEIKYKPTGRPFPVTTVERQDVLKIVYANGEVYMVNNPLKDYTIYGGQHRWNAKLDVFSPMLGYTNLYLEHSKKPGRSEEFQLNLIGLGKNQNLYYTGYSGYGSYSNLDVKFDALGLGLGYGVKFLRLPDYINGSTRLRHILQGAYIKPAISASYYTRNFIGSDVLGNPTVQRKPVFSIAPSITFGKQIILDNSISLEFYGSVGYSYDNVRLQDKSVRNDRQQPVYISEDNSPFNNFNGTRFSSGDFGLLLNGGLRIGYLFDVKKKNKK